MTMIPTSPAKVRHPWIGVREVKRTAYPRRPGGKIGTHSRAS